MQSITEAADSGRVRSLRAQELFRQNELQINQRTDRMLAVLMALQWLGGIAAALFGSPQAWIGQSHTVHIHVWVAIFLGGAIASLPICLALCRPGWVVTRHVMAVGQMSAAALLIHLTGGRIETHFQIFGLLAFLAFYRDWRILVSATLVVAADHALRGLLWPQSIFGTIATSPWRWLEHGGWVLFEDIFLLLSIRQNRSEMLGVAQRRAELESANTSIERKIAERTVQLTAEIAARKHQEVELARARDAAVESARLKAEFLANMSHEIRTPMNGIIGMTGLLLDTPLIGEQKEFVETIRSCGDALLTLINDILDFSKIEAGKLSFETLNFDLRQTVESVVELLAERAQGKKLELISVMSDDVPGALRGDPGRLRQVLVNLVGNAIKFTDRGEVVLRASLERETESSAVIRFTVQDTGIGISEQGRRNLFQAFSQADGSMTRRYGGTGLGLAISKQLVEIMGGQIGVDSQPGIGSTFSFTAYFEKQSASVEPKEDLGALRSVRALIVDDNATSRRVLQLQLQSRGIVCTETAGAEEALRILRRVSSEGVPLHVALIDMQMPDVDGAELARRIKSDPQLAAIHIIMLTSIGGSERDARSLPTGVDLCLHKPIKQAKLFDALSQVLRGQGEGAASGKRTSLDTGVTRSKDRLAPATRERAHILVAEDNPINQKVILRQLAQLGYRADAVGNGLEVLTAVERIRYDLILLDCQMPEMDGYTAARALRQNHKSANVHVIALTAHTMEGDREKCIGAGMDDYLSKPVKVEELEEKLGQWLAGRSREPLKSVAAAMEDPVDLTTLRQVAGSDESFVREMVDLYLLQGEEIIAALRRAVAEQRVRELERLAHTLAGSSLASGMRSIVPPLRQLESLARRGELSDPLPLIEEAATQLSCIRTYLAQAVVHG